MLTQEFRNPRELVDGFKYALRADEHVLLRSTIECDPVLEFAHSVYAGLNRETPSLDCRFLYDARGSALYEKICEQPEYYLTRVEDEILASCGTTIRDRTGPVRLLELGSGNADKTQHLLSAWLDRASSAAYVPVDVSVSALRTAGETIADEHKGIRFVGVNATYEDAMPLLGQASPVMMMFMGSTIGNLDDDAANRLWRRVSNALKPDDFFLLGIDLVKDRDVLEAAYNDRAGVTAEFTLNLFSRMNRELGSTIDLNCLTHEAAYNETRKRIETHVRFLRKQTIAIQPLNRSVHVEAGARILVEISRKFHLDQMADELRRFGLERVDHFTDPDEKFALLLCRRTHRSDAH